MGNVSGGGSHREGSTIEIAATATPCHHFVAWNDGNSDNPRTVAVNGNASYEATFAPIPYGATTTLTVCDSLLWNGQRYTASGDYADTLATV